MCTQWKNSTFQVHFCVVLQNFWAAGVSYPWVCYHFILNLWFAQTDKKSFTFWTLIFELFQQWTNNKIQIVIPMEFPFTFFCEKKINHFFKKEVTSILSNAIIISQQWLSQDQITIIYLMTRSWEISSYTGLKCNANVDV